ncbi:hypothetical protein GGU10DRAFT_387642 [Lentinula aff. detonsa]|uniref:Histone H1 n=1 Tax=Lentinula aff. detonsa TaxID=2804958 RepID=A0AA38NLT5_9AGAR|nr:hypothetical protein GGU10DRAFT_387642 [Lentinula aff. detonsa]
MQVGTSPQTTLYQLHQQGYVPNSAADDYERKRRYLSLLPPPQVIEICLSFDIHIPASVKTAIWPSDLDEAINTLQKASGGKSVPPSTPSYSSVNTNPEPLVHPEAPNTATEVPGPPGPSTITSNPSGSGIQRFSFATQPAYPHTPYYPQASWSSYSHPPYGAPQPYGPTQPYAPPPLPIHRQQPHYQEAQSSDEMPSYEDMIVEALNDVRDPEGLAPKDIYSWMVDHYRVQANFRPSASQALQKAYKRGRFEKSLTGKYRLNPHWKGGNTTRRTTRRPQSHSNSLPPPPPHTRHPSFPNSQLNHANKMPAFLQPSYMLSYPPTTGQQSHLPEDDPAGDIGDAFEAAQHILKALNFSGDLLKSSQGPKVDSTPAPPISFELATENVADTSVEVEMNADGVRAELQAQLLLLAAQLSEIASISSEATDADSSASTMTASAIEALAPLPVGGGSSPFTGDTLSLFTSSATIPTSEQVNLEISLEGKLSARLEAQQEEVSGFGSITPSSPLAPTSTAELITTNNVDDDSDDEDMDEVIV